MSLDLTSIARLLMSPNVRRCERWGKKTAAVQDEQLRSLLRRGAGCEAGKRRGYVSMLDSRDLYARFSSEVPLTRYADIRKDVMRMILGEGDVLWPGVCRNFAQSSGTSDGRSKYVPVTPENLQRCHYAGPACLVAHYLQATPDSRIFSGKGMILGGSFANQLNLKDPRVKVGDVSATLISKINPVANLFRIPEKKTALLPDWEEKLPRLVAAASGENVTNISGVPSWFLTVLRKIMEANNARYITDVWPNLEVFFHGGISFKPYREEYESIMGGRPLHFFESYNASEGFFAAQTDYESAGMLLLIENDVFYEMIPVDGDESDIVPLEGVEPGRVYEMVITSSNGLCRYRLGDTVRIESVNPVRITIAGRTRSYINAFGEELMEDNAEQAVASVCARMGCALRDYTVAPVYAVDGRKGRHQWLIEWETPPADRAAFGAALDEELRRVNSDYDAKRSHGIFLDTVEVVDIPEGGFAKWLASVGTHKLGGQRKVPRLRNDRSIADAVLALN